jgi:thiosulfate dehydrogenase [quinone] large subunit
MSTQTSNQLEGKFGRITLRGEPHALSALFVVAMRFVMGGMILFAGLGKYREGGFDASGYLMHVDPASPASGLYASMASNAALMDVINVIVPLTQVLIGLALIAGAFVRLAAFGGTLQMIAFYLGGWEGDLLALFDSTLIYAVVFMALGAFAAGRIFGLDRYIEGLELGGQTVTERFPRLGYLLG